MDKRLTDDIIHNNVQRNVEGSRMHEYRTLASNHARMNGAAQSNQASDSCQLMKLTRRTRRTVQSEDVSNNRPLQNGKRHKNGLSSRSKRTRQMRQPVDTNSTPSTSTNNSSGGKNSNIPTGAILVYSYNDFLAVRNETVDTFFLCRAKQNIFKNIANGKCPGANRVKVMWYTNDRNPAAYAADYLDEIDFESILTNVSVGKLEKGEVSLPESEKQRALNILERSLKVEKGLDEAPDPRNVLSDGLDISIIGKIEEEEVLSKIGLSSPRCKKEKVKKNSKLRKNVTTIPKRPREHSLKEENTSKVGKPAKANGRSKKFKTNHSEPPTRDSIKPTNSATLSTINNSTNDTTLNKFTNNHTIKVNENNGIVQDSNIVIKEELAIEPVEDISFEDGIEMNLMFESDLKVPFISTLVNSKLLIRSVLRRDYQFLIDLAHDSQSVPCYFLIFQSVSVKKTALHFALQSENLDLVELLIKILKKSKPVENLQLLESMELLHSELMLDEGSYLSSSAKFTLLDDSFAQFCLKVGISFEFIQRICCYFENGLQAFVQNSLIAIKYGHCDLAHSLAQELCKTDSPLFDNRFVNFLNLNSFIENNFTNASLLNTYINEEWRLYPIHLAAINPDPHYFNSIISTCSDQLYLSDRDGWLPIHYASVCKAFFNIQILLKRGVSTLLTDNKGNTPLHLATRSNQFRNAALIVGLEMSNTSFSASLRSYNRKGWTPMHVACKHGYLKTVSLFIDNKGDVNIPTSNDSDEMTPLMIAAKYGHFDLVKLLVENGASINTYDKKNRCALTYAVINGQSHIVHLLLSLGSNPASRDHFGNNLFHYALAYGWYFCYQILLKKTNLNIRETNTFGMTAICAAMMKGHFGLISHILERGILNVNVPINDTGINLVMSMFLLQPNRTMLGYLKILIKKFGCDLSRTAYEGNNSLHYLVQCEAKYNSSKTCLIEQILNEALDLLLENECDPYAMNVAGFSPIAFALQSHCFISFFRFFKEHFRSARFRQLLLENDNFWPLILSNISRRITIDNRLCSISEFILNLCEQNVEWHNLFQKLSMTSTKTGVLPIEHFVRISNQIISSDDIKDNVIDNFLNFILKFYDVKFLESINLLHLAAKYAHSRVLRQLLVHFEYIDVTNEASLTPLAVAIQNLNNNSAQVLIENKANLKASIGKQSCFLFYLTQNESFKLTPIFITNGLDVLQTDECKNTALHLICRHADYEYAIESARLLIQGGLDVNSENRQGQTALHTLFIENVKYTKQLVMLVQVLLQSGVNLSKRDQSGRLAWSYLSIEAERWIDVVRLVDYAQWSSTSSDALCDANGTSLLYHCTKVGAVQCLTHLLAHLSSDAIAKLNHPSPLAVAINHGHKDCASILIKIYPNIKENYEVMLDGKKFNLFRQIFKNNWNDMLFEISENAKKQNKLIDLIIILIKSQCLEYANNLINNYKAHMNFHDLHLRAFLLKYSKIVDYDITNTISAHTEFLKHFNQENLQDLMIEIFSNGLRNWNSILCNEMIRQLGLSYIARGFREARLNPIALTFHQLAYCNDMKAEIKDLILTLSQEFGFNCLASFPIAENLSNLPRYKATNNENNVSDVQYSPLIVAIITRNYDVVQWLLKIEKNDHFAVDLNFTDTTRRTPIMHAVLNNDLKMIKLLFNPDYQMQSDLDFWSNPTVANNPNRIIYLLSRDTFSSTLFHHLISPLKYFNYFKSDLIFSMLWSCLDIEEKTENFISELYKYASSKNAVNIMSLIAHKLTPTRRNDEFVVKINVNHNVENKHSSTFHSDHDKLFKQCSRPDRNFNKFKSSNIFGFSNRQILSDSSSKLPYDVTFTKLDFQQSNYFYNFYKIQLFEVGKMFCLMIRWGQVGTIGNVKKLFFDTKEEAVYDFRKLFYTKSGHEWEDNSFVPNQDNAAIPAMDSKKHAQKIRVDIQLNFSHFSQSRSSLSQVLDSLIRRLITANSQDFEEIEKYEYYNTLNSALLKRSKDILQKIYNFQPRLAETMEEENKRKILLDMIDLSEEYYSNVNLHGNQLDQLKPILEIDDIYAKYQFVQKLSSVIFSKEFLHCAQVCANDISPIDYIYHSFKFNLHALPENSEELDVIKFFLKSSLTVDGKINMTGFRLGTQQQHSQAPMTSKRYLLWLHLQTRDFFNTMVNGILSKSYFDSETIFESVLLTNKIDYGNISKDIAGNGYLLLCEVPMDNTVETQTRVLRQKDFPDNTDCVILHNQKHSRHLHNYLCWKGLTFPLKDSLGEAPNDFIYLSVNKILPRYLVHFNLC